MSSAIGSSDVSGNETIISFEKVCYSHPNGIAALTNVDLRISRGELVAILGSNGAGKSTLVRHINALLKPSHGKVVVFGTDTKEATSAVLSRRVGIVFQNSNNQLFSESVKAEIQFGLRNFGYSKDLMEQRTKWALDTFELNQFVDRPPMELSGGEKKRLCNALVLAWEPEVLILDEPTVGQDSIQKDKLVELIMALRAEKRTVIVVTHDVEFIWPLQPRTVLMAGGKIIADGSPSEVLGNAEITKEASVLQPQLIELFSSIGCRKYPANVLLARHQISQLYNGDTA
jgi:energy-coupling factor transporter ATP-binding protein EcfA2